MTYLFKLARRISRQWPMILLAGLVTSACSKGDKIDFIGPNPNPVPPSLQTIRVEPQIAAVQAGTETQFTVTGYSASGVAMPVTVDWLATGGSIQQDGRFHSDVTGNFQVIARVRGNQAISDSAQVGVWLTATGIVHVSVFPDSATIEEGDTLQAAAVVQLSDGTLAPIPGVTWSTSGGSIDAQGRFTAGTMGSYSITAQAMNGLRGTATVMVQRRVKTLLSIAVSPSIADVKPGQSTTFVGIGTWSDGSSGPAEVLWSATGGAVASNGVYTAGSTIGQYVVVGRGRQNGRSDTAHVKVKALTVAELSITPGSALLAPGATQLFTVMARLTDNTWQSWPVTWQTTSGTIDASGRYTAAPTVGTFQVIASAVGASIADTVSVTVQQSAATLTALHLNPSSASVPTGLSRQFSVTADWSDGSHAVPPVTWSASGGTITASGLYLAAGSPGSYVVVATGPGGSADTSVVTVVAPVLTQLILSPASSSVLVGQTVQFSVSGLRSDGTTSVPSVNWSVSGGAVSSTGLFTAGTNPGTYAIVATEQGGTLADTGYVTITVPIPVLTGLMLTPASAALASGASQEFHVIGTWSDGSTGAPDVVYSATGGTMSGNLYTAGTVPGAYRVIATEAGGTKADTSSVLITSPVTLLGLSLSPAAATVQVGRTQQLSVSAVWSNAMTTVPPLTWSATGGTVSGSGLFTAGTTPGSYRVIARHQAGTKADTASVTVSATPAAPTLTGLSIAPKPATLAPGATAQFSATASWSDGSTTVPPLTWSATGGTISAGGLYSAGSTPGSYRVIAVEQGGTEADTSAVTITSGPAATLTSVVVTPGTASLPAGGVLQFTAAGQYSDGSTGALAVTWSGTGGVVSVSGRYTAGTTPGTFRVIATQQGGTKKDTAAVTITAASAPTLTAVVVTPGSVSLQTGGVQQFTAAGQYSDGSTGALAVTWSGTGGVASSTGLYSAGMTPGSYRVIATQQGGSKADTAAVTLSVAPPTSALHPNEPSGMTWSNERDFDAKVENGWTDRGDANFSIIADPTSPSPANVGQAKYPLGFPSGQGPIATTKALPSGLRTLYVSYWIKISANWLGNSTGGNKVVFFHIGGGPGTAVTSRVYSALRGSPTGGLATELDFQGMGTFDNATHERQLSWNGTVNQNTSSSILTRDVWKKVEVVLIANTPGKYDGQAHWWLDGVKVGSYTAIGYSSALETGSFNTWQQVTWNPTWGGSGPALDRTQYMWMDRIYVSGK